MNYFARGSFLFFQKKMIQNKKIGVGPFFQRQLKMFRLATNN